MYTFQKQPHIQKEALQKALKSPRIGRHGKRKSTLAREAVLRDMQERTLRSLKPLIEAQFQLALYGKNGGPDNKAICSILDRMFGKPTQSIEVGGGDAFSLAKLLGGIDRNSTLDSDIDISQRLLP